MTEQVLHFVAIEIPMGLKSGIAKVASFFRLFGRALEARREWDRLSTMSDRQLARAGLSRAGIHQAINRKLVP